MNQNWFKGEINKKLPEQTSNQGDFTSFVQEEKESVNMEFVKVEYADGSTSTEKFDFNINETIKILHSFGIEEDEKPLGKGNFGEVWRGMENRKLVAIKILKSNDDRAKKEMHKEVAIFRLEYSLSLFIIKCCTT